MRVAEIAMTKNSEGELQQTPPHDHWEAMVLLEILNDPQELTLEVCFGIYFSTSVPNTLN